jgi:membrane fusion protein, copper/silver efflux system
MLSATLVMRASGVTISIDRGTAAVGVKQPQAAMMGKQLYYSTMHPCIVQDHPGMCPICGMELVKMPADMQADWERKHDTKSS